MALYAVISPGGSPGATTTALAAALSWPDPVLVAECDPSGGSALAGYFAGRVSATGGLLQAALEATRDGDSEAVWQHTVALDASERRLLLPGLADPGHAIQLDGAWGTLASTLAAAPFDVIADIGRIGGRDAPYPLVSGADLVVMVLAPTLRHIAAARPRLEALRRASTGGIPLGLCLVGAGPYDRRAVGRALSVPVLAELADDPRAANVLSDGAASWSGFPRSALMRSASRLVASMRRHLDGGGHQDQEDHQDLDDLRDPRGRTGRPALTRGER
ncbi:hypothetical protein [Acrocarpospora sp. B8E8]|uniref:hypothetical protein n=1 Tax=Acrocarpospora sp. B8E8 TaxID=3153572 RepID=UPI00325D7898